MKSIGKRRIYLTGSKCIAERAVYEKDGKYFIRWYGSLVEVYQRDGFSGATAGWMTFESY